MSDEPLLISTLASAGVSRPVFKAGVPCLTLACHPDPRRIGERALLTSLLARQPVSLARGTVLFGQPDGEPSRPLRDPYLSREPVRLRQSGAPTGLVLEGLPPSALLDGRSAGTSCRLPEAALQRGVLLQLSSRILLLLHSTAAEPPTAIDGILGFADEIDQVRRRIFHIAGLDVPVLIRGESGVGKERVAQALHAASPRGARALVAVNMATLNDSTAASALFGHARGAFTGAVGRHRGFFERADGGTLFLDEVGDTPASVQTMLLRALETGYIQPLGDEAERRVNVRVIAATESHLERESNAQTTSNPFRSSLKHRLAGYEIHVPPLRERLDDVPRLLVHFLRLELRALGRESLLDSDESHPTPPLRAGMMARLMQHAFPGNVRELINFARRLAIQAFDSGAFELYDLPAAAREPEESADQLQDVAGAADGSPQDVIDESALLEALERHKFSPHRAAAELGVAPSTLHFWMRRHGIRRATDIAAAELEQARVECGGDVQAMARRLRVSERALRLTLRRHDDPK